MPQLRQPAREVEGSANPSSETDEKSASSVSVIIDPSHAQGRSAPPNRRNSDAVAQGPIQVSSEFQYRPMNISLEYQSPADPQRYKSQVVPHGYRATFNSAGHHPQADPDGYHPMYNQYEYHPKHNQYGYHPDANPYGYHPDANPYGHHPKHNPYGYHPKHNPMADRSRLSRDPNKPTQVSHNLSSTAAIQDQGWSAYQQPASGISMQHRHPIRVIINSGVQTGTGSSASPSEKIDLAFCVQPASFFFEGKVFAVIMNETAGVTASNNYNPMISSVRFQDNYVYTNIRRFVVVRQKKAFCFACPISIYSGRATTKPGVQPQEHSIAYSWGHKPQYVPDEQSLTKQPIPIVMARGEPPLPLASRINFGIMHPIQYNVKVKEIGRVPAAYMPALLKNWQEEDQEDTPQACQCVNKNEEHENDDNRMRNDVLRDDDNLEKPIYYTQDEPRSTRMENVMNIMNKDIGTSNHALHPERTNSTSYPNYLALDMRVSSKDAGLEPVINPRKFFKKGRVFMCLWAEPKGMSDHEIFSEMARFAVVKTQTSFSICLRISTYSGQATTKPGISIQDHAAVLPEGGTLIKHPKEKDMEKTPIFIKVENPQVTVDPMSRINCVKPYSIEHNVMVRNIGRVIGESVGLLEKYFAESLGYVKV